MNIAVIPAEYTKERAAAVSEICGLLKSKGAVVHMYGNNSGYESACDFCGDFNAMLSECDLVLAIGGDGTMMHAAKHACDFGKPVLGVNCGRLGYLATVEKSEISLLEKLFSGDYTVDKRMMLSVEHTASGGVVRRYLALNDAVLGSKSMAKAIDIRICCNGRKVFDFTGDGIIFSSPTGSTAYAFSAGGPVVDPQLCCVSVTPVCPHSFDSRTVVFSEDSVLTAVCGRSDALLAVDGEAGIPFSIGDTLRVCCSEISAQFIRLKDQNFYDVLSNKIER